MNRIPKKRGRQIMLTFLICLVFNGWAVKAQAGIGLQEAIELALANPNNLGSAQETVVEAQAQKEQAKASRLPSVAFNSQYTKIGPHTTVNMLDMFVEDPSSEWGYRVVPPTPQEVDATGSYNTGFSLQLPLSMGGKLKSAVNLATFGLKSAEETYAAETANLVHQVIQAYIGFLKADRMWTLSQQQIALLTEHIRLVETNLRLGYAAKTDLMETQIQLTRAELGAVKAEHGRKLAAEHLGNLLGIAPSELTLTSEPRIKTGYTLPRVEVALEQAQTGRSELKSLAIAIRVAEENLRVSRNYWQPNLALVGNYGTQNQTSPTLEGAIWSFTLNLDWKLWAGGAGRAGVRAAEANLTKLKYLWAQSKDLITLEVRQNWLMVTETSQVRELTALICSQAAENYEIVKTKFKLGAATNLELLTAQNTLNLALNDQLTAEYDYYLAVATFYKAMGRIPEFLQEVSEDA